MTELNIKKEIGHRIHAARKAKGLTLKKLGELAGGFKQSRLTNWELGTRTPGPEEIKQLAEALDVSLAFLMCLSDDMEVKEIKNHGHLIPMMAHRGEANLHGDTGLSGDKIFVSICTALQPELSANAFALKIADESMVPEFRINDVVVIDPSVLPEPGDFVGVKINGKPKMIICQYKKLSYTTEEFELITLNDNWPNIKVSDAAIQVKIIGKVVQNIRNC